MQLGMIGLGKMGANMARRLQRGGHEIVALDLDPNKIAELEKEGMKGATNVQQFAALLTKPRLAWLMVPSGDATESMVNKLAAVFEPGDILIDGGNSYFKDDVRRGEALLEKGIHYADVGTSGGVWGLERGYCLMIGAAPDTFAHIEPILKTLSPGPGSIEATRGRVNEGKTAQEGYLHCGPVGSGHFVKMVHNGIEYGLMQAYGEGFDIMRNANSKALADQHPVRFGSGGNRGTLASWQRGQFLAARSERNCAGGRSGARELHRLVQDSGEGRWTIMAALEEAVPAEVLALALYVRFRSRQEHTFTEKMLSAMRKQFGGHLERHGRKLTPLAMPERLSQKNQGRPADRCIMVIFGASGDLTTRKLLPALYNLLPQQLAAARIRHPWFRQGRDPGRGFPQTRQGQYSRICGRAARLRTVRLAGATIPTTSPAILKTPPISSS